MPRRQGKVERYQFTGAGHLIRNLTRSMADRRIHHDDRRIHHPRLAPSGAWHRLASGTVWRLAPSGRSALHLRLARTSVWHVRLTRALDSACTFRAINVWNTAGRGTARPMLYTVFIVLAIVALLLFIFGRRRV
jgi:hypothetical protein